MHAFDSLLMPLTVFALAAAFTPGPNNIMLTASGANFGFRRTIPHMLGVTMGFSLLLLGVAFGLGALFSTYPAIQDTLRLAGCAYLLYFAWRIATARRPNGADGGRPFTILQAAGFQFVNPKAWMMGISAMTAFTLSGADYRQSALLVVAVFVLVTVGAVTTWASFGTAIGKLLKTQHAFQMFNVSMALLTVASIFLLFV
jgi:threonine/homoserine/homoserine lactone efflux protein